MDRRHFLKKAGKAAVAMPAIMTVMPEALWSKVPENLKINSLDTIICEDEVYLKLITNQGIVGEGHTTVHRKALTVQAALKDLERYVIGENPTRLDYLWQGMNRWPRWKGGDITDAAISGIDLACWDILGKALDVPVWQLLGGLVRDKMRIYISSSGREGIARLKSMGLTATKCGPPFITQRVEGKSVVKRPWNLKESVRVLEEMRDEAGDDFDIGVDAHGYFNPVMAMEFAKAVEHLRLMFLEEPVQQETYDHLYWLKMRTTVPLATGERNTNKWEFVELINRQLVDYIQPDVIQCGGITEFKKISAMAESQYIDVCPHCPGALTTGLGLASLHLDFAIPNHYIQESRGNPTGWQLDLLSGREITIENGYVLPPQWPGLGLKIDWEVAKKHPAENPAPKTWLEDGSVWDQ